MFVSGQMLQNGLWPSPHVESVHRSNASPLFEAPANPRSFKYDQTMAPAQHHQYDPRLSNINASYTQQMQSPPLSHQPNGNQTPASQTMQQHYYYPEDQPQPQHHQRTQFPRQQQPHQPNLYFCLYEPCGRQGRGFARQADLERHLHSVHNRESKYDCPFPGCARTRAAKGGFPRKDKMTEHLREVHKVPVPKRVSGKNSPS